MIAPRTRHGPGAWLAGLALRRRARAEARALRPMQYGPPEQAFRAFIQINIGQRSG
jgi:hypothetical protein